MNERLRRAMALMHIDVEELSRQTGVDPKTVQRWLNGRMPHPRHRWKLAELLDIEEAYLWPETSSAMVSPISEFIMAYARRSDANGNAWWQLFIQAQEKIDLLANAMLFLPEHNTRLVDMFMEKASNGCQIRIALADPECEAVKLRDEEERLGGTLPGRIRTTLYHFRYFKNTSNISMHYHSTILYNSLFRADNEMFVTPHLYGLHGSKAPMLHLRRLGSDGVFSNFQQHFEDVWATTRPIAEVVY